MENLDNIFAMDFPAPTAPNGAMTADDLATISSIPEAAENGAITSPNVFDELYKIDVEPARITLNE